MMVLFINLRELVYSAKLKKHALFCSIEISDVAWILASRNGRNKD